MVTVFIYESQSTLHPRFSAMNLTGSIVLPFIIIGTTLGLSGSIGVLNPLTFAILFPVHNSIFVSFSAKKEGG